MHQRVRDAREARKLKSADHVREHLERAALHVELDGHLCVRCGEVGDDQWLTETVGEGLVGAVQSVPGPQRPDPLLPAN